jgi:hypothetical protein
MKRRGLVIGLCLLAASTASAQTKTPLEGVWKIAEVIFPDTSPFVKPGAPRTNSNPEPSLIIFTRQYYSRLNIEGQGPRPPVYATKGSREADRCREDCVVRTVETVYGDCGHL